MGQGASLDATWPTDFEERGFAGPVRVLSRRQAKAFAVPEGYALASGLRRAAATSVDVLFWLAITSLVWTVPIAEIVDPFTPGFRREGVWPGLSALSALAISGGLSEALSGRTLGKMLLGVRVAVSGGSRPSIVRSLARNVIKYACPPLALLSLSVPDPHLAPGAMDIAVLERHREPPEPTP